MKYCESAIDLDLGRVQLDDELLIQIGKHYREKLQGINRWIIWINDSGLVVYGITDAGMIELIQECPNLKRLDLRGSPEIGGVEFGRVITKLKHLEEVSWSFQ